MHCDSTDRQKHFHADTREWASHVNVNSVGRRFMQSLRVSPSACAEKHAEVERAWLGVESTIRPLWKASRFPKNFLLSFSRYHTHTHTPLESFINATAPTPPTTGLSYHLYAPPCSTSLLPNSRCTSTGAGRADPSLWVTFSQASSSSPPLVSILSENRRETPHRGGKSSRQSRVTDKIHLCHRQRRTSLRSE